MNQIAVAILFAILCAILILSLSLNFKNLKQHGGYRDPYAWIRPMLIVDFFRNFWFTR